MVALCGFVQNKPKPEIKGSELRAVVAGKTTKIALYGENFAFKEAKSEKSPLSVRMVEVKETIGDAKRRGSKQVTLEVSAPKECKPDVYPVTLFQGGEKVTTQIVVVEAVETLLEPKRPCSVFAQAMPLPPVSCAIQGSLGGDAPDYFRFEGNAGERWAIVLAAGRAGSSLDAIVRVRDSRRIALAMSAGIRHRDRRLVFVCPANGAYTVEVSDTEMRGGKDFNYLLVVKKQSWR
jgi:hypothetical protein